MIKRIGFVRRHPRLGVEAFHERWRGPHADLVAASPAAAGALLRYEQHHRLPQDYGRVGCDLDGVTIEWFRSARDFFGMAMDPESRDVIRADEERFLDPDGLVWMLTGPEHVVLDRISSHRA